MGLDAITGFFSHIPTDWILILAFAALVAFDTMRSGSGRAAALALTAPVAIVLAGQLSQAALVSHVMQRFTAPVFMATAVCAVFVLTYILVRRMGITHSNNNGQVIQALMAGSAAAAVLVAVWLQVPELQSVWHFGSQVQTVFGEQYRFWWIIGSYVALAFIRD